MTEERKNEIENQFILNSEANVEELKDLEIQEIIFLIYSARYFKEKEASANADFEEKIKILLEILNDKIKNAEVLYIAYDKNTNYPYIDEQDRALVFSKEEHANDAEDYFAQQSITLKMIKVVGEEVMNTFAALYLFGINKVVVDNREYNAEINREDIFSPPDWSGTPEVNIPLTNPNLQHAMIKFFQLLYLKSDYAGKTEALQVLENKMLDEIINAKYLIPMQLREENNAEDGEGAAEIKQGTSILFGRLMGEDDTEWIPVFTDWGEFEKVYDKNVWHGNIVSYEDLISFSKGKEGIIVNLNGISLRINENTKKIIEKYKKRKAN